METLDAMLHKSQLQAKKDVHAAFNSYYDELMREDSLITCDNNGECTPKDCDGDQAERCNQAREFIATHANALAKYLICPDNGNDYKLCQKCNGDSCTECTDNCETRKETTALSTLAAEQRKREKTQEVYDWVQMMGSVMFEYLKEKGDADILYLSGWGDWGRDLSGKARDLLDPEEWKNNLCNPNGAFTDFTQDDGAVYAWQEETYRAVLTFAGERLPYETRAAAPDQPVQNLYTLSFVAVSPSYDNAVSLSLEPGGRAVTSEPVALARKQVVSKAYAVNDSAEFREVCLTFTEPFPQPGGDKRYCRPLQRNAYDRGGATNATLPDWGVEDPYGASMFGVGSGNEGVAGLGAGGASNYGAGGGGSG